MKILVTSGAYKHSLAVVRALGKQGHCVSVVCNAFYDVCNFSSYCRERIFINISKGREYYLNRLLERVRQKNYDLLIPVGHPVTGWVSREMAGFEKYTRLVLAIEEQIAFFENKQQTQALAERLGVPVPLTFYPESIEVLEKMKMKMEFPAVIKDIEEGASGRVFYVKNAAELEPTYRLFLQKRKNKNASLPMVQAYLSGQGAGFFALYDKGRCVQYFMHRRIREYPVSGGSSCCAESYADEQLLVFGKKILDAANWHGLAMVEFKYDAEGTPRLLEVNPKLWGSFDLSVASGVSFLGKMIAIAEGKNDLQHEPYLPGIRFSWLFNGDLANGLLTGRFFTIIRQMMRKTVFTNLHWDDPLATLNLIIRGLLRLPKEILSR